MTGPRRARLLLVLTLLSAAGAARLLAPPAAALLPAAVSCYLSWATLRCFPAEDPLRRSWLALGLAAGAAALTVVVPGQVRPFAALLSALLLGGGVHGLYRRLAPSALAVRLSSAWTVAAAGLGLGVIALALGGGPARDAPRLESQAMWVLEGLTRGSTAAVGVLLLGLAIPLYRGSVGPPLTALAGASLVLATQLLAGHAAGSWPDRVHSLGDWLGWSLVGLAAWALLEMRNQALALLTAAREDVIRRM